jgi:putative tricarboxylic transport membrane protein
MMTPIWLRTTRRSAEFGAVICLLLLGGVILLEGIDLGAGWGESGPQPGFFPFVLTVAMILGALGVLYANVYREPNLRPFFEVSQEVTDLLRVGIPILVAIILIRWLGIYVASGLYLAFFMAWYGKFRWWQALAGGLLLPLAMWLLLQKGFALPMPMSIFYRTGHLPI